MRETEIGEIDVQKALIMLLRSSERVGEGLRTHCGVHLQLECRKHRLSGAVRSVFDSRSETDILADWVSDAGHRLRMLIEVKLEAQFMKLQGSRYRERVQAAVDQGAADSAVSVLVAPKHYFTSGNVELHQFDVKLALEEVATWARDDRCPEAELLDETLSRIASGRPLGAKGLYRGMHDGLAQYFGMSGSSLRITNNATDWVFVDHPSMAKGVRARYRISAAIAEVRISKHFACPHERLPSHLPTSIQRVTAGTETLFRHRGLTVTDEARKGRPTVRDIERIASALSELIEWWSTQGATA